MIDLAVIGSGPAGYEAAAHAAKLGMSVLLFEKGALGGVCLNVGCIPTKTFLRSAKIFSDCKEAQRYGVTVESPSLDMSAVQERKRSVIATLAKGVSSMLKQAGVKVIEAEAIVRRSGLVEAGGDTYEVKNILVATGSMPALPPIPGLAESAAVMDSSGILEVAEIPRSLVVIGAGVIGLEFACFFAEFGTRVTLIEMLDRIAPVVDAEIAGKLQRELKRKAVTFNLSSTVSKVDGDVVHVVDGDGGEKQVRADIILNATGRQPRVEGLGLEKAGVDLSRKGIRVDAYGHTNVPGIWAGGDCTGRLLLAHAATREGIVAVNNMAGKSDRMRHNAIPSVIYTHPEVAHVGPTEEDLQERGIAYRKTVMPMAVAGRFIVEEAGKSGTVKVLVGEQFGQILAVHMIGGCCGEFVASAVQMVEMELCVDDVREIVFPHPTVSEALRETILRAGE